ncbi:hypothetical protein WH47_04309 [Habropoda laboriosa]|uniref:Uncharacterized protein n=1 Tax=Habropoda laboriosa TaxID=597456 RepID=A0A0L7QR57_9HYME|nr:hypothetical protein WH47_04309 [Habropoda laboriosa]
MSPRRKSTRRRRREEEKEEDVPFVEERDPTVRGFAARASTSFEREEEAGGTIRATSKGNDDWLTVTKVTQDDKTATDADEEEEEKKRNDRMENEAGEEVREIAVKSDNAVSRNRAMIGDFSTGSLSRVGCGPRDDDDDEEDEEWGGGGGGGGGERRRKRRTRKEGWRSPRESSTRTGGDEKPGNLGATEFSRAKPPAATKRYTHAVGADGRQASEPINTPSKNAPARTLCFARRAVKNALSSVRGLYGKLRREVTHGYEMIEAGGKRTTLRMQMADEELWNLRNENLENELKELAMKRDN